MIMFNIKKVFSATTLLFLHAYAIAQDTTTVAVDKITNSSITEELWYMQKWVWIFGGAVLLLVIIGLLGGGRKIKRSSTERVVITKKVETESAKD